MSVPVADPPGPAVAVVVVTWNSRDEIGACLGSLARLTVPSEVVVVDNASADGTAALVQATFPAVRVLEPGSNLGFGAASNRGWRATAAPAVLFLNPDTEVDQGAVESLLAVFDRRPEVGIVGPATRDGNGTPQVSFGPDLTPWSEWRQRRLVRGVEAREEAAIAALRAIGSREHEPDWVSGSCLLVRRALLERLGGFDERFFLYEEDVDLCTRARQAGARVLFTPEARVVHHRGRSMGRSGGRAEAEYDRSHLLYYRKHRGLLSTLLLQAWMRLTRPPRTAA